MYKLSWCCCSLLLFRARQGAALEQKVSKGTADVGAANEIGFEDSAIGFLTIQCGQLLINPHLALCRGFPNSGIAVTARRAATPSRSTIDDIVMTPSGRQALGFRPGHIR